MGLLGILAPLYHSSTLLYHPFPRRLALMNNVYVHMIDVISISLTRC